MRNQKEEENSDTDVLKKFDMNMKYGPCVGISRKERWERAFNLGIDPPQQIKAIIESGKYSGDSIWERPKILS